MSYELENLDKNQPLGVFTNARPLVAEFRCTSAESRSFVIAITCAGNTGAGPTYASPVVQTTWDDGDTWVTVTGVELQDIDAVAGTWLVYATAVMSPVSPRCRVTWTPVAAHTITVTDLRKARHAPGDSPISTPPNTSGGITTVTISAPIGADTIANSLPVTIATDEFGQETMAASLPVVIASDQSPVEIAGLVSESWLGLTVAYPSTTQETYEFFEDAAKTTSICVVTIDYSDASKINMTSVVRA